MPTNRQAHITTPATHAASSAPAKYQQVADAIRVQIESGVLPPGAPLPTEAELMTAHGVSQPTVRSAVRILREQGLVTTYHGRGSFVRHPASDRPAHTLNRSITTDPNGPNGTYRDALVDESVDVEEPSRYRTNATPALALALGVAEHTPLFVYDRLMTSASGQRFTHRTYIPFPVAADVPALEDDPYRSPGDLYTVLASHLAHHIQPNPPPKSRKAGSARKAGTNSTVDADGKGGEVVPLAWAEHVRARVPTPDDIQTLRVPEGSPLLVIHRETRDYIGRLLTLEEVRTAADNAQLTTPLTPIALVGAPS